MQIGGMLVFSFFKKQMKKSPYVTMLSMDNETYAEGISEMFIETMDSATRAHVLVAYQNLLVMFVAFHNLAKEREETFSVEQTIKTLANKLDEDKDEINSRRHAWFLFAALLGRLEKIAHTSPKIAEQGAQIWCSIAEASPHLKSLLPDNIVWKANEKELINLDMTDNELIGWTINRTMPPAFAKLHTVETFARSKGIFYYPSDTRFGIIP